jgi:hypothetical protein
MASQDAFIILNKPENLDVARDIYADIQHRPHNAQPIAQLDEKSWRVVRKAFERHTYVLVSPVRSADKPFDWTTVPMSLRNAYVIKLLVETYHYTVNGAAGLVGNLDAESSLVPNRIEGTKASAPMHAPKFGPDDADHKPTTTKERFDWTPEQIRDRDYKHRTGPRAPGIGIAQWTSPDRRNGLFRQTFGGQDLGVSIISNMDAQVAYLVSELKRKGKTGYQHVDQVMRDKGASVEQVCDVVHWEFERPKSLYAHGHRRAPTDVVTHEDKAKNIKQVTVQDLLDGRRRNARNALNDYLGFSPK